MKGRGDPLWSPITGENTHHVLRITHHVLLITHYETTRYASHITILNKEVLTMSKKLKIAVIGAGSTYTPELVDSFIKKYSEVSLEELYLMDIDSEKLSIIEKLVRRMVCAGDVPVKIK